MRRVLVLVGVVALLVPTVLAQSSLLEGTWKLNVAKSTYRPDPPPKSQVISWKRVAGGYLFTTDTVNAQGQASHTETLEKDDGSEGPVKGSTANRTRYLRRIDDHTYEDGDKTDGKPTFKRHMVISRDGKTITNTVTGTNTQGQPVSNVMILERQ